MAPQETEADARSGVFYALMNQAPEIYRTLDYGGTWQSVTMSHDDPETGLRRGASTNDAMATSSVPGEVAIVNRSGATFFSTDYGLTWRAVGGASLPSPSGAPTTVHAFWGHASPGAPSVLMAAQNQGGGWEVLRADMSAPSPSFVSEGADPFGAGSVIDVADSQNGSFVGRANSAGELSFASLTPSDPVAFGPAEATGLPSPPVALRLGGANEPAAPPDGALVAGGNGPPFNARMLTKNAGANSFAGASASGSTSIPGCNFQVSQGRVSASVAPTSTGTDGAGSVGTCWLQKDAGADLTVTPLCCSSFGDWAYDANWGSGNNVAFMTHPDGPHKSARLQGGVPEFNPAVVASPGPGEDTGGLSVNGIASASVEDAAYGPTAQDLALAVPGAQMRLASRDGGANLSLVGSRGWGAGEVNWWQGESGEWLVFGGSNGPDEELTAVLNWDPSQPPINGGGNVTGSRPEDLGGAPGPGTGVEALAPIPGTDMLFIGVGTPGNPDPTDNDIFRARIQPGSPPSLVDKFNFEPFLGGASLFLPGTMAYCPTTSVQENMRDVLFVAMSEGGGGGPVGGGLLRIAGATTDSPSVTAIGSVPTQQGTFDVRAHCGDGVVYAGGMGAAQLYRSTDGGFNFGTIPIPAPPAGFGGPVTAIGVNPGDANDVTVAIGLGNILHSSDAANTETTPSWAQVNDPNTQRKIQVHDIEFAPGAGSPTIPRSAGDARGGGGSPEEALMGTGGGAFEANVGVSSGIIAFGSTSGGTYLGSQLTTVTGDAEPSLAVDPGSGRSFVAFRRSNGLAFSATENGSWSIPVPIPGTAAGDDQPSLARDPSGGLQLAFRRPGGSAAGIYHMTRGADGVWSVPQRMSNKRGDGLPSLAVTGKSNPAAGIAFVRTKGKKRSRGVYSAVRSGTRWRTTKLPRTSSTDTKSALGGPSLAARGKQLHLAFARSGKARGIAYSLLKGKRWSKPKRLSRSRDSEPAMAMTGKTKQVVFRRQAGKKKSGLYALVGGKKWSLKRVRGTTSDDGEPALVASGSGGLALAFARAAGQAPGVYQASPSGNGAWRGSPRRVSANAQDHDPSPGIDTQGRVTVVLARG